MLKKLFKLEKWFGIISLIAFMNMALFSYDALCAQTLSRDKAATLIEKSMSEVKTKIRLHDSGYQKGLQHGMWQTHEKSTYVTDHGALYFQSINYSADFWGNFAAQAAGSGSGSVTLKKPVNLRVKVTGIRGGAAAEFTWEYVGLPSVVKRYVVRGGNGTAQFTLYDDGWRLTNINIQYSTAPAHLTAKEIADDEKETKIAIEWEHNREIMTSGKELRLPELFQTAKTATKELAKFNFKPYGAPNDELTDELTVTDVGISVRRPHSKKQLISSEYLFIDLLGFSSTSDLLSNKYLWHRLRSCPRSIRVPDERMLVACANEGTIITET